MTNRNWRLVSSAQRCTYNSHRRRMTISEDDGVGDLYSYDHQMREAASLELGYSLDEDERMIFRSICKQAGIGDIAGSSSHQSTNNCQTSPTISQPSLYTVTAFPSKSLKPQKMRSFLAVAISPTLLHSIHHKRFSCGNQPEPPTSALGPVPTGNFGPVVSATWHMSQYLTCAQ
ncbi:hypothetical protein PSTG_12094 [Puccinia striiformis f. sp. tritici PST-78]|uniref:Uncharacterized protein n=1 Tax=Puccinia striiformis f. sp. tritici PST-78 TaxID=1165861 RepID=A0A0L0V6D7_9BASI|nr:hypothetical protein PSTG_12094 [Puccinia striiformis f. sp. tritici PST-78]